ncbi:Heterokaryon incompatibility protein (HET) domain containing protein [Rhypophila sp. PSN 637]
MDTDPHTQSPSNDQRVVSGDALASFSTDRRCTLCNNLERRLLSRHVPQYRAAFDFSPDDLRRSSSSGCPFCGILVAAIQQFEPEVVGSHSPVSWIYARGGHVEQPPHTLSLEIYFSSALHPKLELELYQSDQCGVLAIDRAIRLNKQAFQPIEPLSEASLSWVRTRLGECLQSHWRCSKAKEAPLPPRVLSLTATASGAIDVALQESSGSSRGTYACLSHRWGGLELGVATKDQYPKLLCEGVSWSLLPQTFQDVVRFTVALGINYLWIDSLCIIQDDSEDGITQAGLMAGIYQNSFVTLAATSSPGSDRGCFWTPDSTFERTFETAVGPLSVRKTIKHWGRLWTSNSEAAFPLLTRAWVFQERLLAPRALHFSHHELAWTEVIELYTSLRLTNEQDRLTALHGFATWYVGSLTGHVMENNYLAGLWGSSLHNDLMWRVDAGSLSVPPRLCRCLDFNSSEDSSFRCQYSFASACSPHCLEERRLCWYGFPAAAVSRFTRFNGACPGQEDAWSCIAELRKLYKASSSNDLWEPRQSPSWSWISVGSTGVEYWSDIRHLPPPPNTARNNTSHFELKHAEVHHRGNGMAGPVAAASLELDGLMACPVLQYRYEPDPADSKIQNHSIWRYGLAFSSTGSNKHLEFYPDYALCLEGEGWMPESTPLFILHVSNGVHLVLQKKDYFSLDQAVKLRRALQRQRSSDRVWALVRDPEPRFVRIGILRSSRAVPDETDWPTRWLNGVVIE